MIDGLGVALALDDVDCRLAADELGERSYHDRIAEIGTDLYRFIEDLVEPVQHSDIFKLEVQVGDHSAGHLMNVLAVVVFHGRADRQVFSLRDIR